VGSGLVWQRERERETGDAAYLVAHDVGVGVSNDFLAGVGVSHDGDLVPHRPRGDE
jgi:hypothetical protein